MGGRGASSGKSVGGKAYGTQYKTLFTAGDIKFVSKATRQSEALMETKTKGRVYVETGGNDLLRIIRFGDDNKRNTVLERDKRTGNWHKHIGYLHAEHGQERHLELSNEDRKNIDRISRLWYDWLNKA